MTSIRVCVFLGAIAFCVILIQAGTSYAVFTQERAAAAQLPKNSVVFKQFVQQNGVDGIAARLPNGTWMFCPKGASTFTPIPELP